MSSLNLGYSSNLSARPIITNGWNNYLLKCAAFVDTCHLVIISQ